MLQRIHKSAGALLSLTQSRMDEVCLFISMSMTQTFPISVFRCPNNWFKAIFRAPKTEIHGSPHAADYTRSTFLAVRFQYDSFAQVQELILVQVTYW